MATPTPLDISLTDFVDFVAKSGTPRLTHVRQIKLRDKYDPRTDFWKALREGIVTFHQTQLSNKVELDAIAAQSPDPKKRKTYPLAINGYKSFLGKKVIAWFKPTSDRWKEGNLQVRVNPELGLVIGGVRHHLKLYLKSVPLRKDKADMILLLLKQGLTTGKPGDKYAILDVQRNKLFAEQNPNPLLLPLLQGEAIAFSAIWGKLPAPPLSTGV